jgi:hypothetical protein
VEKGCFIPYMSRLSWNGNRASDGATRGWAGVSRCREATLCSASDRRAETHGASACSFDVVVLG